MEFARFTERKTGQLRKFQSAETRVDGWLFIPDPMPPNWDFAPRLWPLLVQAKEALGTLNGIGRTLPNSDLLLRPLQNREAVTSSSIEGTYVTPKQLLIYDMEEGEPRATDDRRLADWGEVFNYRAALIHGCDLVRDAPITNQVIRSMHQRLMAGGRGDAHTPGQFRRIQVQIGSTARYVPPPPGEVPALMGDLEKYINSADDRFDPLVLSFVVHYQIEAIHPFSDGNGRIGRVLLALMIYKLLGHSMPWLFLSPYFERYKDEYTDKMLAISTHGDWESWIEFCLNGTIHQARDAIRRCDKIRTLRIKYEKLGDESGTPRARQIIDQLFYSPVVSVAAAKRFCKTHYQTAKNDLQRLVDVGVLSVLDESRPKSYFASELFAIAYGNAEEEALGP